MKRISIILFLLLEIPGLACSQMNVGIVGGGVTTATGGCTYSSDSKIVNLGTGSSALGSESWNCSSVSIGAAMTITGYLIDACLTTGTGNITMWLYNNSGTAPTTAVSGTDAVIAVGSLDACATHGQKEVLLGTPKTGITAATYWVCANYPTSTSTIDVYYAASALRITHGNAVTDGNTDGYSFGGGILGCLE